MGRLVMGSSVPVAGFVADESDQPGPLFDWMSTGDVPMDESGEVRVGREASERDRPRGRRAPSTSSTQGGHAKARDPGGERIVDSPLVTYVAKCLPPAW